MFKNLIIPLKYKFLAVLMFITLSALGVFFYFTNQIFSEDKKLFVLDLNLTLLRAATSEIKLELRTRLEELQILIPRVYRPNSEKTSNPFEGLSQTLSDEVLRVRIYRKSDQKVELAKDFQNIALLGKKKIIADELVKTDAKHPLPFDSFFANPQLDLLNRSTKMNTSDGYVDLGILSFMLPGSFVDSESKELVIVIDLLQDFLRKKLNQSEVAQIFLLTRKGNLISHGQLSMTVQYAFSQFQHPVVQRVENRQFSRESFELDIEGEAYLCNVGDTGFNDIVAVSQIRKSDAFAALTMLMEKSVLIAALILSVAVIISILFASRLTSNISKLKYAAEQIGQGNLKLKVRINSNDEIQSVSQSFQWMIDRLKELIRESAEKFRMEQELETARLVQSTLLMAPQLKSNDFELQAHYVPATECGGDVWDAKLDGNILTVYIADATGHGAPAAIVTAVAKSCFTTLNAIYAGQPLSPDVYLQTLNYIVHNACKGKLLMTMCIVQLNLETGELAIANAGHESPLLLRGAKAKGPGSKYTSEVLFARGERLGFEAESQYETVRYSMNKNDTILLFTDGVSEAQNSEGKEWGERNLKKVFASAGPRSLATIKTEIVEGVNKHTHGMDQHDDITFVLVSLKANVGIPKVDVTEEENPGEQTVTNIMRSGGKKPEAA